MMSRELTWKDELLVFLIVIGKVPVSVGLFLAGMVTILSMVMA